MSATARNGVNSVTNGFAASIGQLSRSQMPVSSLVVRDCCFSANFIHRKCLVEVLAVLDDSVDSNKLLIATGFMHAAAQPHEDFHLVEWDFALFYGVRDNAIGLPTYAIPGLLT